MSPFGRRRPERGLARAFRAGEPTRAKLLKFDALNCAPRRDRMRSPPRSRPFIPLYHPNSQIRRYCIVTGVGSGKKWEHGSEKEAVKSGLDVFLGATHKLSIRRERRRKGRGGKRLSLSCLSRFSPLLTPFCPPPLLLLLQPPHHPSPPSAPPALPHERTNK